MVHLKVTDENNHRSPLIQGGLEISVEVICEMDDTPRQPRPQGFSLQKMREKPWERG